MVPKLYADESLEETPELLQVDSINDSEVERPGKVEEVKGDEPEEDEKDGGSWVVVETQRKSREKPPGEEESRTGRLKRMYPTLSKYINEDPLVRLEEEKGLKEMLRLEEEEEKMRRKWDARTARW